jgi:hypothetical protein
MAQDDPAEKSWQKIAEWLREERDPKKITELVGRLLIVVDRNERKQPPPVFEKAA